MDLERIITDLIFKVGHHGHGVENFFYCIELFQRQNHHTQW